MQWDELLTLNAADRDIVVNLMPIKRPAIAFDTAAYPDFDVQVGHPTGPRRTATGWQLDRTLMPLEVLAVCIWLKGLRAPQAMQLSPSGEWRPQADQ